MNPRNSINCVNFLLLAFCCLLFVGGCASLSQKETVLAVVDGEPITEEDLKYSLQVAHRRENLSTAVALNLSEYVLKLVDDRLIIHEARTAGMDQYPEVKQAIEEYILRESVVRLHDEEVVQKVFITEEEIKDYYKLLKREESPDEEFEKVKDNLQKAVRKQKEKERSDAYLRYLREKASIKIDNELLSAINLSEGAEEIEKWTKDKRTLVEINIHNDINQRRKSHSRESGNPERDWIPHQVRNDGQSDNYAVMYSSVLTVGDFVAGVTPGTRKSSEDILESWIDRKLVDHEALSRHYEMKPDLKKMSYRYENQLLKNTFIKRIILPQVVVTDKNLEEYYATHQKSFIKPTRYKIQQITVKSRDEAQEILDSLQKGADFSWVAKRKSTDSAGSKGGDIGWFTKSELPESVREIIDTLKVGDISPIIKIDPFYRIVRLQDKTEEEVKEFKKVKDAVYRACFNEQINTLFNNYVTQLKTEAQIKVYDEEVRTLEEKLQK